MKDDKLNFEELIKFVEELLDKTGVIALNYFRETRNLSLKGDQSPVTHADHEIEKLIRSSIQEKFPTHSIIGEEFEDQKKDSDLNSIIENIDGTRSINAVKNHFETLQE